ncbi:hypothetical protein FRB99_005354 [Tulasnella sp. 403]|nr:hypothetical protein FRB99_005354 [Tulasnella sp. 403]
MFTLSIFLVIVFLLVFGRIAEIRHDGVCVIGLKQFASLSLLSFDLFITLCLTILFVYPLMRKDIISPRLRRVAKRTLAASIAALITSAVNLAVLTIMHGKQLGWVCLSSCGTDVTLNAIIIFWVTAGTSASHTPPHPSLHLAQSTAPPEDSKYDRNLGYLRTLEPPGSNARLANQWRAQDSIFEQDDGQNTYAEDRRSDKRDLKLISPIGNEDRDGPIRQTLSYTEPRSPPSALSRSIQVFHCSQPSPLESSVSFPSHGILHVQAIGKDPLQPTMAVSIPPFIRKSPFTPSDTGDLEVGGKAHGSGSTSCASLGKSDSPSIVIPVEIVASTSKDANQNQRVSYYVRSSSRTPSDHSAPTSPVPPTSSHPTIQRRATDGDLNGRGVLKGLGDFVHRRTRKDSNAPRGRSKVPGQSESQERRSQSMLTTQATDVSAIEFRRHGSDLESFSCTNDSNSTPYVHQYSTNRMHRPSTVREGISTDDYLKDSSEVDHNSSTLDHHSKRDRKTSQQLCPTSPSISSSQSPDPRPHRTRYSSSIFSSKSNKPR